ncbi:glutathione transferase GST 23-like [Lotus japonicus]|uniref:glutathione transferase GST 23-like n=1 Tax=Lotus japonicus TaxID=34305 RepID=UPI00258D2FB6|nr:glutathione transferase GST 23-like [Lotus japonicus]
MAGGSVTLIGSWASPFVLRVKWALELKGVEYQYVQVDLHNKSDLLLQYNPVYKKVPVLVHDGKHLAESLVILEYIDETWKQNPLLPHDPYERARARFWSRFIDEKCMPAIIGTFSKLGEEQQKAAQELRENLKILEGGLEGKRYFGGETIGFADIAIGWLRYWVGIVEEIVGINLIDTESMAKLNAWFDDFQELPIIKESMPPRDKLLEKNKAFHKFLISSST